MSVNTVFTALALPPPGLALAALLALVLLRGRAGRGLALLASLDVPPAAPGEPPQAIVVLGGDVDRLAGPPGASLGSLSLERVRAGAALHRRTGLPVLVTGGTVDDLPLTVGALMAESLAADFNVPVRWTEAASPTTWENAEYSASMLKGADISRVYLVTHAWHMRRSLLAFERAGIDAVPAPVRPDPWPKLRASEFLPRTSAWVNSFFAMHEWVGLAYYAARR